MCQCKVKTIDSWACVNEICAGNARTCALTPLTHVRIDNEIISLDYRGTRMNAQNIPENWREWWEERAAILEYDAGLPREQAEQEAARYLVAYVHEVAKRHAKP
jgi:hypothetical protein